MKNLNSQGNSNQEQALSNLSKELVEQGLNKGTSGNCSVRYGKSHFLITPSGTPVDRITAQSIVSINISGVVEGDGIPSSEWRFHRDIYVARPEVNAIVHVHSPFATAFSCMGFNLPSFHYMIAVAGGNSIRCAPYQLFGTQELSDVAIAALVDRKACFLANHGMISVGESIDKALAIAVEVESLCEQYIYASQLGRPNILSETQMVDVLEKFKGYGNWAKENTKENDGN